jgi:hypothetical protein
MPSNEPVFLQGVGGQPTDWVELESGLIKLVAFDNDNRQLYIRFKNGVLWRYDNVPYETYKSLVYAGSSGAYFRSKVVNQFVGVKVDDIGEAGPKGRDNSEAVPEPTTGA